MKIIQIPNKPLIIALTGLLISKITSGMVHKLTLTIYTVAIVVWAYLEITDGANWFRRLLGLVVMFFVAYSLYAQLN